MLLFEALEVRNPSAAVIIYALGPFESREKENNLKKSFFSLLTEGFLNEKIHFSCFFAKFYLFASQHFFSVKMRKNERNKLNLFVERG